MMTFSPQPQPTKTPTPRDAPTAVVRISRVTFTGETTAARSRRRFTQPRRASAVEEDLPIESAAPTADQPEPLDHCVLICVPEGASNQSREGARALFASGRTEATPVLALEHNADILEWRPGLAVAQCRESSRNDIVAALVDFAFYEGNLRALEQEVEAAEAQAQADVALAHRMRYRNKTHWERLTDCSEQCSRMRLTFARLEPLLYTPSRSLSPTARGWMSRLIQKGDIEARLEGVSDRLEALEDLYEGATQRVSDYRWYISGHALEIGIIVLLLIECSLMSADLYFRNHGRLAPESRPAAAHVQGYGPLAPNE